MTAPNPTTGIPEPAAMLGPIAKASQRARV